MSDCVCVRACVCVCVCIPQSFSVLFPVFLGIHLQTWPVKGYLNHKTSDTK